MKRSCRSWRKVLLVCVSVAAGCAAAGPSSAAAIEITEFRNTLESHLRRDHQRPGRQSLVHGQRLDRADHAGGCDHRIQPAGLNPGSKPVDIVEGSDGNLWFSDHGTTAAIGQITPAGAVTEFHEGLGAGTAPGPMVLGADGNVWFIDEGTQKIGRVTTSGVITEFPLPAMNSKPNAITVGPDGNVWFTDEGTHAIGKVTQASLPETPPTEFPIEPENLTPTANPTEITAGPDGNVWFSDEHAEAIGRVKTNGTITEFPVNPKARKPSGRAHGRSGRQRLVRRPAGGPPCDRSGNPDRRNHESSTKG